MFSRLFGTGAPGAAAVAAATAAAAAAGAPLDEQTDLAPVDEEQDDTPPPVRQQPPWMTGNGRQQRVSDLLGPPIPAVYAREALGDIRGWRPVTLPTTFADEEETKDLDEHDDEDDDSGKHKGIPLPPTSAAASVMMPTGGRAARLSKPRHIPRRPAHVKPFTRSPGAYARDDDDDDDLRGPPGAAAAAAAPPVERSGDSKRSRPARAIARQQSAITVNGESVNVVSPTGRPPAFASTYVRWEPAGKRGKETHTRDPLGDARGPAFVPSCHIARLQRFVMLVAGDMQRTETIWNPALSSVTAVKSFLGDIDGKGITEGGDFKDTSDEAILSLLPRFVVSSAVANVIPAGYLALKRDLSDTWVGTHSFMDCLELPMDAFKLAQFCSIYFADSKVRNVAGWAHRQQVAMSAAHRRGVIAHFESRR